MASTRKSVDGRGFDPSLALAMVGTAAFYGVVLQPSMQHTMLAHYTTEHAVEYVIVALFMWGLADVAMKSLGFPREIFALRETWLPAWKGREPIARAQSLLDAVRKRSPRLQSSKVGRRISQVLEHATHNISSEEYRDYVRYLAEQDEDRTQASYTLARFVIGVSPVLGFLGTVVHFGTALSGISFDKMNDRLPIVVAEMGTAFNTTTVALTAAMTMMFLMFLTHRIDEGIVNAVNRLVDRELLKRFEFKDPNIVPFLSVVKQANAEALNTIDASLQSQIELWSNSLDKLFQRFAERQAHESDHWQTALAVLQNRHETYDAAHAERLQQSLSTIDTRQEEHLEQIQAVLNKALALREDFTRFAKTMDTLANGEGKLAELQATLSDNLRVLHETHQIDQALHGLTAAIHILTARHRVVDGRAAA